MTGPLFREDAYLTRAGATVVAVDEAGRIELDRTVFYATSGGQAGDTGRLDWAGGSTPIVATVYAEGSKSRILHVAAEGAPLPAPGMSVTAEIDEAPRRRRMRMHTALHLLSVVLPYPVTGGSVGADEGRLDFDIPEPNLDPKAIEARLAELVAGDHPVTTEWITDAELDANPGLVKTMSVAPPRGSGRIRLVRIGMPEASVDLQPCGGTHVRSTGEIGGLVVTKIEKKGKLNRRVRLAFA